VYAVYIIIEGQRCERHPDRQGFVLPLPGGTSEPFGPGKDHFFEQPIRANTTRVAGLRIAYLAATGSMRAVFQC
jgi:hypothetical protein